MKLLKYCLFLVVCTGLLGGMFPILPLQKTQAQIPTPTSLSQEIPPSTPTEVIPTVLDVSPLLPENLPRSTTEQLTASPDSPLNLTMSPISLIIETDPGVPVQREVRIRNNSNQAEKLRVTLGTFVADESGQRARLQAANPNDPTLTWMDYPREPFIVEPGEWKTLNVTFSPPPEAALTYYYSLIFSRADQVTDTGGKTVVNLSSALLVLTTVRSPNAKRELSLTGFSAKFPIVEFLPQEFELQIRNNGNIHLAPDGNIFLDGQGRKDLAVLSINEAAGMVLPGSQRTFTVKWVDGFPLQPSEAQNADKSSNGFTLLGMYIDLSKADRFRFGRYTAHLLMIYDNGERDVPVEASVSFWVLPWRILLLLLIQPTILVILILIIVKLSRRRR